jgi:hypothetical protein
LVWSPSFILVERKQARPMFDLSYFRKPNYIGANLAQFSFSAGMLTMLTFIPIFLQSGLGHASASAGLMMLPTVIPMFVVARIVTHYLAHRFSGRDLLTAGLSLVLSRALRACAGGTGRSVQSIDRWDDDCRSWSRPAQW